MVDQDKLLHHLRGLLESQFKQILLWLKVDESFLPSSETDRVTRAIALIKLLKQEEQGLQRLQKYLDLMHPDRSFASTVCPYQGLLAFQEEQTKFFFGRETFSHDLVQRVKTNPLVAVVGASGSGKSSLVFAGLVPRLRNEGTWLIESFRPGKRPFDGLASAFVHQLEPELDKVDRIAKVTTLANTIQQYGFATVVAEILKDHAGQPLLLVVDQFEELLTQCSQKERDRFIDVLLTGINDSLGLKVVLTLRADFCGQAYAYRPLADALQGADLKLGPMNRAELQQAIEEPAKLMAVAFEDKLVERLLDDVRQEPGTLPLLEFALTQLWAKQDERMLTHQAYSEVGGIAKALANHAEAVYAALTEEEQKQAQRIFLQLVNPGDGTEDTRRLATRGEVGVDHWNLVAKLAGSEARLVVTGRKEERNEEAGGKTGGETVEIVHEVLLREWQRLRDWMEEDRAFRVWQEGLRFARRKWQHSEHDESALLDGFLLNEAEGWQSKRPDDLSPEDSEFIQRSGEAHIHKELKKISAQLELETERKQKEVAEQSNQILAKAQTKAKRVTRFGFAIMSLSVLLGILFIIILPWAAIFFNNRGYTKFQSRQKEEALQNLDLALMLKPDYAEAFYNKGLVYESSDDFERARANYQAAVRQRFPPAYSNLGRLQIVWEQNYTKAIQLLEEGTRLKTDDGTRNSLFKNLGWSQLELHQYAQAENSLRTAIASDNQRGSAHCLLAQVLEARNAKFFPKEQWENCLTYGSVSHPDEALWIEIAKDKLKK